jgi:hypothetical protein
VLQSQARAKGKAGKWVGTTSRPEANSVVHGTHAIWVELQSVQRNGELNIKVLDDAGGAAAMELLKSQAAGGLER